MMVLLLAQGLSHGDMIGTGEIASLQQNSKGRVLLGWKAQLEGQVVGLRGRHATVYLGGGLITWFLGKLSGILLSLKVNC